MFGLELWLIHHCPSKLMRDYLRRERARFGPY
jgi:hypothetical protein